MLPNSNNVTQLSPPPSPTHSSLSAHLQQLTLPQLIQVQQELQTLLPQKKKEAREKLHEEMVQRAKEMGLEEIQTEQPVKYRNPDTGETWSGKGRMAGWLKALVDSGHDLESYRV